MSNAIKVVVTGSLQYDNLATDATIPDNRSTLYGEPKNNSDGQAAVGGHLFFYFR
jgi:hypothetical protein